MAYKQLDRILKIGIFTEVYKPVINGVVNAIEILYETLVEAGHKVYIFAPRFEGYTDSNKDVYRFKSISLSSRVDYPVGIPFSRKIFKQIQDLDLDIIHCHHPFLMGRLGKHFAKKFKIPLVVTLHTQYENYIHYIPLNKSVVKKMTLWALRDFTKNCDILITPAESRKKQLIDLGIDTEIKVIPNAVDLGKFSNLNSNIRRIYSISPEEYLLIFVGRIAKEKNIDFLIDCFKDIYEKMPDVKLMLVGDGPEKARLEKNILGKVFSGNIIFTGRVEPDEIGFYYNASDIFVSTSTTEVHPVVLLEAMASKLPVVAIKSVGYQDTVRSGIDGFLCEEEKYDFSHKLLSLLESKEKIKSMGQSAFERVKEFSRENIIEQILELYFSLLNN